MKDLNLQKGIEQIKKVTLTNNEKSKMLHNLSMYADLHAPVSSPFSLFSFFEQPLARRFSYVIATMLILALTGGSLAYASEVSLPGDLLYPVKTNVIEPIRLSMAKNVEAKAILQSVFANKRLREAEGLDRAGKLTPEFKSKIDERFNTHLSKYNEYKNEIEKNTSSSSKYKIEKIQKDFDDKMNIHNKILNKLDRDTKGIKRLERNATTSRENEKEDRPEIKRPLRETEGD